MEISLNYVSIINLSNIFMKIRRQINISSLMLLNLQVVIHNNLRQKNHMQVSQLLMKMKSCEEQ